MSDESLMHSPMLVVEFEPPNTLSSEESNFTKVSNYKILGTSS